MIGVSQNMRSVLSAALLLPVVLSILVGVLEAVICWARSRSLSPERIVLVPSVVFGVHLRVLVALWILKQLRDPVTQAYSKLGGERAGIMVSGAMGMAFLLYLGLALFIIGIYRATKKVQGTCICEVDVVFLGWRFVFFNAMHKVFAKYPVRAGCIFCGLGVLYALMALLSPFALR